MTQVFLSYLLTSLIGTVSALTLLLIKPITKKYFSASWHYYAWLAVLIVMMVPLRAPVQRINFQDNEIVQSGGEFLLEKAANVITENKNVEQDITEQLKVQFALESFNKAVQKNIKLFTNIWLLGIALVFVQKIVSYKLFVKNVLNKSCKVQLDGVGRNVEVRIMTEAKSPFVIRCIKPILVLPDKSMPEHQLKNVLAHEFTHIKRRDILYKWLAIVCKAVHWFNPFMYLIAREIEKDCEISCDETAARNMNEYEKKSYAETIMSFAFEYGRAMPLTTSMATSKKTLKNRLIAVKNSKRKSKMRGVLSIVAVFVLLLNFSLVSAFAGGILLSVSESGNCPRLYFDEEQALYGYKDGEGNVVILPQYLKAGDFHENAALVILPENPKVLRVIAPDGTYLFDKAFSAVNNFNSGYALVVANDEGEYSYINKEGELATEMLFDAAENFCAGFALVQTDDKWGVVDTNFNFKVPCKYDNKDEALEKLNLN
ncbi:MAG: WG repeat-containing protein [Clostridia bacterium]|nr:WG repeat-containing protein [Clostridia bacterium]